MMLAGDLLQLLWRFRFLVVSLLLVLVTYFGWQAYQWQASQLAAVRIVAKNYQKERDAEIAARAKQTAVLGERESRNARLQTENSALRKRLRGYLDTPEGAAWGAAPLPAALSRGLSASVAPSNSAVAAGADAAAGVQRHDQQRPP